LSDAVLVTGASGMLGLHIVEGLVNRGVNVVSLVNPGSLNKRPWAKEILRGTEVVEVDILDRDKLKGALRGKRFNSVVHTVAVIGGGRREYSVNYRGTVNLVDSIGDTESFVYISAVLALGDTLKETAVEEAECKPRTWYERSKCDAERLVRDKSVERGWRWVVLRPGWIYGKYTLNPDIPRLLKLARRGVGLVLGGKGTKLALVSAEDVAGAVIHLLYSGKGGIYNVRGPRMYTSIELAEAMLKASRGDRRGFRITIPKILLAPASRFIGVIRYILLAPEEVPINKLEETGWKPRVSLEEGLRRVVEWLESWSML
jgi:UDP-glucose 4-epimerase